MTAADYLIAVLLLLPSVLFAAWVIDQAHARRDERDGWDPSHDVICDEFNEIPPR